ncbi:MAG: GNAT family N-acetyltransferase [Pyrinomonadaceae bacterium]|nr:GNAT family N-acetyltransferase [Pyrinomonadaceae bacterium]
MRKNIVLVPVHESDGALVEEIYFYTRNEEFAATGWGDEQLKPFLKMQCDFQRQSYNMQFPTAEFSMIVFEDKKVGRLIVDRSEDEIRLVDIAILPEFRSLGIGGQLIGDLFIEAEKSNIPVGLQVEKNNQKAFRLYQKLGFEIVGEDDIYISMEKK